MHHAKDSGLKDIICSYNIACEYSIHFYDWVKSMADSIPGAKPLLPEEINRLLAVTWQIGRFHLGGHRKECTKKYSFNYNEGVGCMSGQSVETIWSTFNWLTWETREMGPGPRYEALTDAMSFWNRQKEAKLGGSSRTRGTAGQPRADLSL